MTLFYTDQFVLPLPPGHRFPMEKYSLLRERLTAANVVPVDQIRVPRAASDEQLLRAHSAEYVQKVVQGQLTRPEILRIGFPWSREMVERCRRSSGATIEACEAALRQGFGANLAGGTHHAFRDAGEGFCVFNDTVVAARELQARGAAQSLLVIDCDVHQGNGTAAMANAATGVFTFSLHGAFNFPFHKEVSDIDIGLADGTTGEIYLAELGQILPVLFDRARPDIVIYVSGADPFEGDRFGRLKLTKSDLAQRDRMVVEAGRQRSVPVAVSMGGGYASQVQDTVEIHFETIRLGVEICLGFSSDHVAES